MSSSFEKTLSKAVEAIRLVQNPQSGLAGAVEGGMT